MIAYGSVAGGSQIGGCWILIDTNEGPTSSGVLRALMQLWEQSHLWIMQVITFVAGLGDGVSIENTSDFSPITINHDQYPHNNSKSHHGSSTRIRIDGANAWRASIRKALASTLCQLLWKFKLELFAQVSITLIWIIAIGKRRVVEDTGRQSILWFKVPLWSYSGQHSNAFFFRLEKNFKKLNHSLETREWFPWWPVVCSMYLNGFNCQPDYPLALGL